MLRAAVAERTFADAIQGSAPSAGKWVEGWEHRRWLLRCVVAAAEVAAADGCDAGSEARAAACEFARSELSAAERAVVRHARNYNAWTHRWLAAEIAAALDVDSHATLLGDLRATLPRAAAAGDADASLAHYRLQLLRKCAAPAPLRAELPLLAAQLRRGGRLATRYALRTWARAAAAADFVAPAGACAACRAPVDAAALAAAAAAGETRTGDVGLSLEAAAAACGAAVTACSCPGDAAVYSREVLTAALQVPLLT